MPLSEGPAPQAPAPRAYGEAGATTVVAMGMDPTGAWLRERFGSVRQVATIQNAAGVDNDEDGTPVWLCRGRALVLAAWPVGTTRYRSACTL
jgi:hypothetical protein